MYKKKIYHSWSQVSKLVFCIFLGSYIMHFLGMYILGKISVLSNNTLQNKTLIHLLIYQAMVSTGTFIIGPYFYIRYSTSDTIASFFNLKSRCAYPVFLTVFLMLTCIVLNTLLIQWNASLKPPAILKFFEQWSNHTILNSLLLSIAYTSNKYIIVLTFITMAIIPAIGEEFLFRGIIQKGIYLRTKNIHIAIALSALIFSAVHLDWHGFFPRIFLGFLLGYIYWHAKDLLFPIMAHCLNNVVSIIMLLLYKEQAIQNSTKLLPSFILLCCFIMAILLYWLFAKSFKMQHKI